MDKKKSLPAPRSLASLFLTFALVTTAIAGGPGTATALDYEECAKDWLSGALVETAFDYLMGSPNHCLEITDSNYDSLAQNDHIAAMTSVNSTSYGTLVAIDNRLEDSQAVALTKAKITIINELNNGSNKSQARAAAKADINDYYAGIERELLVAWNKAYIQQKYMADAEEGVEGSAGSWATVVGWSLGNSGVDTVRRNDTLTLVNGDDMTTYYFRASEGDQHAGLWPSDENPEGVNGQSHLSIRLNHPDGNTSQILKGTKWKNTRDSIVSQSSTAKSNIDVYVDGVYANYTSGEIDASDLAKNDPTLLYQEASTQKNSTGYYGYAAIQLAALGYAGNVDNSHVVTVNISTANATTYEGTLFYTADDLESIETGTTIDTSEYSGLFMMAVQNGSEADIRELKGNLTIDSATNVKTGEAVETTTIEKKVYGTTNVSTLEAELQALRELREEYEEQATFAGSGGGGGIDVGLDIGSTELLIVVAGVGVFVLALFSRRD